MNFTESIIKDLSEEKQSREILFSSSRKLNLLSRISNSNSNLIEIF